MSVCLSLYICVCVCVCAAASCDRRAARCHPTTSVCLSAGGLSLAGTGTGTGTELVQVSTAGLASLNTHLTDYPTTLLAMTSSSAGQVHQFLNSAGQIEQFAATGIVDVLRVSPRHSLLSTPPVHTLLDASQQTLDVRRPDQLSTLGVSHDTGSRPPVSCLSLGVSHPPVSCLPCSQLNAFFTANTFPTHFLPTSGRPVIGCQCVAGQHMIGCECSLHRTDCPMAGVVCPLATHWFTQTYRIIF